MPERSGSVSRQISERKERKPLGLPSVNGELANSAVRDRLQRERDAQLLHHVGFGGEVEVGLHRAGAVHHVEAERADLRHVGRHDAVAPLRHHRHLGARPVRRHAEPEEADAERARDLACTCARCAMQLGAGLVHGLDRRAGQLELAARLERDRAAAGHVEQADDVAVLDDRLPAEQMLHAFEQRADAAAAVIGNRAVALDREGEFLVLGADAELRLRLARPLRTTRRARRASRSASCRLGRGPCRVPTKRAATIHGALRKSNEALVMPAVAPACRPRI